MILCEAGRYEGTSVFPGTGIMVSIDVGQTKKLKFRQLQWPPSLCMYEVA